MISRIKIPADMLEQIEAHAREAYPSECCGMIFGPKEGTTLSRVRPCVNAQDKYHALDPETFPRQSDTAYFIEPRELLAIDRELTDRGERIAVIYHSHPDHDAYFSEEDVRRAVSEGTPIYPGTAYLVISVKGRQVVARKTFFWDEAAQTYVE